MPVKHLLLGLVRRRNGARPPHLPHLAGSCHPYTPAAATRASQLAERLAPQCLACAVGLVLALMREEPNEGTPTSSEAVNPVGWVEVVVLLMGVPVFGATALRGYRLTQWSVGEAERATLRDQQLAPSLCE